VQQAQERGEGRWGPEDEAGEQMSDSEFEEPEELKRLTAGRSPTREMREQHEIENHAVYRDWCDVCVGARGVGTPHRRKERRKQAEEEREGARIYSDFYFMNEDEQSMPMLAIKFSRSKRIAATALEKKGVTEYGVKFFGGFIQQTGVRRFINHSDNEPGIEALKSAAARSVPGVESVPRNCPVGDHQANGEIESGVRELKRQMRAVRMALERRLGRKLEGKDPVLAWIPTFSGDVMARHRKGKDGKTPYERETGRKWAKGGLEFGEKVFIKEAKERAGRPKRDWEPRMIPVRYVGHHARTGAVIGLTSQGVRVGQVAKRLPTAERWSVDGWEDLRGLPWNLVPDERDAPIDIGEGGAVFPQVLIAEPEVDPQPRNFYVRRADVAKHGSTIGCPGCAHIGRSAKGSVAHSQACRARIMVEVEKEDADRIESFRERMFRGALERVDEETAEPPQAAARASPAPEPQGVSRSDQPGSSSSDPPSAKREPESDEGRHKKKKKVKIAEEEASRSSGTKRASETPVEELDPRLPGGDEQETSSGSGSRGPVVIPGDVPRSSVMDVEDAVAGPGDIVREASSSTTIESLIIGGEKIMVDEYKMEMIPVASLQVRAAYRRQGVDVTEEEVASIAALQVELGAAHVLEIFSPKRFTAAAPGLGLRPGFAVDLCEAKPYGDRAGENWDLAKDEDVDELEEMVDFEKPVLLTGSPPCDPFSQLLRISEARADPEKRRKARELGVRHLRTAVRFYRKQHNEGRYFLHEHPSGASSWEDPEVQALQQMHGVFTVKGPMCRWGMEFHIPGRENSVVFKETKWVTNSRQIAKALDWWCGNKEGGVPHRHLHLVGGIAKRAAAYPPRLVRAVLKALKEQMMEDGTVSPLEMQVAGPVPTESTFEGMENIVAEYEKYFDNVTGEELPAEDVRKAREVEIGWVRSINLYDKVPRSVARDRGITPLPVRWVDVDKGDFLQRKIRSRLVGKELKAKTKDALLAHELFSATPPWEAIKALLSMLVTDGMSEDGEELELGVFDISRAHFMPEVKRELYIEIPNEDKAEGEGDVIGRLNRNMYGFRDASNGWMEDWQKLLETAGYVVGTSNRTRRSS